MNLNQATWPNQRAHLLCTSNDGKPVIGRPSGRARRGRFSVMLAALASVACGALGNAPLATAAETPISVAVVDFTSSQRTSYSKSLPEYVVDQLVNRGDFDVLEREKLASIVAEVGFQSSSGFVTPDSAVQVGGMLGARILISGHILDHSRSTKKFKGYGVSTTKTTFRLKARLEAIDVTTGSKLFSHVAEASREIQAVQSQVYDSTERDMGEKVATQLVDALMKSKRITALVSGPEAVSVMIASEPAEADVEIDGTYYGSAGQAINLVPGVHNITVSLPGYVNWEKRVMVQEGTSLKARLQKDTASKTETKLEVEIN